MTDCERCEELRAELDRVRGQVAEFFEIFDMSPEEGFEKLCEHVEEVVNRALVRIVELEEKLKLAETRTALGQAGVRLGKDVLDVAGTRLNELEDEVDQWKARAERLKADREGVQESLDSAVADHRRACESLNEAERQIRLLVPALKRIAERTYDDDARSEARVALKDIPEPKRPDPKAQDPRLDVKEIHEKHRRELDEFKKSQRRGKTGE